MLEDKVESLVKLNRINDAIVACKNLFHLSTSFVSAIKNSIKSGLVCSYANQWEFCFVWRVTRNSIEIMGVFNEIISKQQFQLELQKTSFSLLTSCGYVWKEKETVIWIKS